MADHNILSLLDAGLKITVNSDDPAYFGGYVHENLLALYDELQLNPEQAAQMARNSFEASFATQERKTEMIGSLDDYLTSADTNR